MSVNESYLSFHLINLNLIQAFPLLSNICCVLLEKTQKLLKLTNHPVHQVCFIASETVERSKRIKTKYEVMNLTRTLAARHVKNFSSHSTFFQAFLLWQVAIRSIHSVRKLWGCSRKKVNEKLNIYSRFPVSFNQLRLELIINIFKNPISTFQSSQELGRRGDESNRVSC